MKSFYEPLENESAQAAISRISDNSGALIRHRADIAKRIGTLYGEIARLTAEHRTIENSLKTAAKSIRKLRSM